MSNKKLKVKSLPRAKSRGEKHALSPSASYLIECNSTSQKGLVTGSKISYFVILFSLMIGLIGLISHAQKANAESFIAGPLTVSYDGSGPIFSEDNYKPGDNSSKTLTVKNNGSVSHSFALATKNVSGNLADKLYLKPTVAGSEIWSRTVDELSKLSDESQTVVPSINPGQTVTVDLRAELDSSANNDYQSEAVSFDLVFGTEEAEPAPTATSSAITGGDTVPDTIGTTGATGILGRIRSIFAGATASPLATASPTATATPEVKGAETGNVEGAVADFLNKNKNWLLLLITPILAAIVLMVPTAGIVAGVGIPLLGGVAAMVLSYFIPGDLKPLVFWIILICEIVLAVVMNYILLKKDRIEADLEEKKNS